MAQPQFDSHVHIWENPWEDCVVGTWRAGRLAQRDLMLALLDRHGVQHACVVAACNQSNSANNEFVAELCRSHPDRFVMFSEVPVSSPRRDELLERTLHEWPALGLRYILRQEDTPLDWQGPAYDRFWGKVNDGGLFVALNLNPTQAGALKYLIQHYPKINWLLDHMARPRFNLSDSQYQPVLDLAAFPNVLVKISGFYAFTEKAPDYPYHDLARFVRKLLETFGPDRMLWGSDAPPALDSSSYEQTYACLEHLLPEAGINQLDAIFGRTAERLFLKK